MPNPNQYKRVTLRSSPIWRQINEYVLKYLGQQKGFPKTLSCSNLFMYVLVLHKISSKGSFQSLCLDGFSIDACKYDTKNCSPQLQDFLQEVKNHLKKQKNQWMIPKMKQMMRQVVNIFLPVFAIAMTFICVKQQMLTTQTYAKLNKLFKRFLGELKIEKWIGTGAKKLNIQELCNEIIDRSKLQKMKQKFFYNNNQISYEGQFVQKRNNRKKQDCGPFVFKQPLDLQNIQEIIAQLTNFKDLITRLGRNAPGIQGDKKVKYSRYQSRKNNEEIAMSQNQQIQQEDSEPSQMVDQNQIGNGAGINSNITQFNSYFNIDQFLAEGISNDNSQMSNTNNFDLNLYLHNFYIAPLFSSPKSLPSSDEVLPHEMNLELNQLQKFDNAHFIQNFRLTPNFSDIASKSWF